MIKINLCHIFSISFCTNMRKLLWGGGECKSNLEGVQEILFDAHLKSQTLIIHPHPLSIKIYAQNFTNVYQFTPLLSDFALLILFPRFFILFFINVFTFYKFLNNSIEKSLIIYYMNLRSLSYLLRFKQNHFDMTKLAILLLTLYVFHNKHINICHIFFYLILHNYDKQKIVIRILDKNTSCKVFLDGSY